ncbi:hypothetical protein SEUCBS139899_002243 [Sporothrix eucalyptigena]|uniref:VWFA domain-containing protein n=1 Tax=Sporothrix eucalyptigena TaxID=1812306 RepID=A0ABP0CG91_9PEZI
MSQWLLRLRKLLPLDDAELTQVIDYTAKLPDDNEAAAHLQGLLGDSPEAVEFVTDFVKHRGELAQPKPNQTNGRAPAASTDEKAGSPPDYAPPPGPPPSHAAATSSDAKSGPNGSGAPPSGPNPDNAPPPSYAASSGPRASSFSNNVYGFTNKHTNALIQAGNIRARDEQEMQQALQNLQYEYRIYNPEIEPEHESDYYCSCSIHQFMRRKMNRLGVQRMWADAVMYPGERFYSSVSITPTLFSNNPYYLRCGSPFGYGYSRSFNNAYMWGPPRPSAVAHLAWTRDTINLSNQLNHEAQMRVDNREPRQSIWEVTPPNIAQLSIDDKGRDSKQQSASNGNSESDASATAKKGKFASFKKSLGIKSSEEKATELASSLRASILAEEAGRWPDSAHRQLVAGYQQKVGMASHIADLRARKPIQYLHLLRAGYFEPIPVAWATQASNPLKFTVEAREGWRGITPAWRGYEDLAEERLYWVLNHREGSVGMRMKPDFISEMDMAQRRMANAVEPPPMYFSPDDTCMRMHTASGAGYSKQVMPSPFRAFDRPEQPSDDSMILLDVSGSMDFDPVRPIYDRYLITGYARSTQPKNKEVAKSIIRRFTDALAHHDHQTLGYDLVTFANRATYIGAIHHRNFDQMWRSVRVGGGTRVMTGWQKVKELHFQKHHESAIHHPVYGWQAGPETPILRLLLFLDGEATDMDEFELDLLGLSWAHVTIFLIGVDNCPHHHRHANELQRISDVNHHVSFVDAQGNCPERFVTHELLKRHLGYDISLQEFEEMEQLPAYTEV